MSLLGNGSVENRRGSEAERTRSGRRGAAGSLLAACSNPECASGWLRLWRSREWPVFEGGWSCSAECTTERIGAAVRREMEGRRSEPAAPLAHRHRVPLGLVMLEQGWITPEQLRGAVEAQRAAGEGRLGEWLMRREGIAEHLVTRALSLQWSCAVLPLARHDAERLAPALPRLFVDAFGALPLRVAAGQLLYIGFEERPDPVVTLAVERISGLRAEAGLVHGSLFQPAHREMLRASYPRTELVEAASSAPLARVLTRAVERAKPVESRLVRVHDCLWLRMWTRPQAGAIPEASGVEDVICSLVTA